jgi:hypothetical protein
MVDWWREDDFPIGVNESVMPKFHVEKFYCCNGAHLGLHGRAAFTRINYS